MKLKKPKQSEQNLNTLGAKSAFNMKQTKIHHLKALHFKGDKNNFLQGENLTLNFDQINDKSSLDKVYRNR